MIHGYGVSSDSAVWGQLGDYSGGILSPILNFISIVLLVKSLSLQNEANSNLRSELKNNEKTEKLRSFEALFFNMINSQKELFNSFEINFIKNEAITVKHGVNAVIAIEEEIERIKSEGDTNGNIRIYLDGIDSSDKIFSLSRAFYVMVKIISDKLSDANGFNIEDRKSHFQTLINFTDFAQLRLIMISVQFMQYSSSEYLKNHHEFISVLGELGISCELY